jgi:hypothetical protein
MVGVLPPARAAGAASNEERVQGEHADVVPQATRDIKCGDGVILCGRRVFIGGGVADDDWVPVPMGGVRLHILFGVCGVLFVVHDNQLHEGEVRLCVCVLSGGVQVFCICHAHHCLWHHYQE